MTASALETETDEDARAARKRARNDARAKRARERYAQMRSKGLKRIRNASPRRQFAPRKPKYDALDYAAEWMDMASLGVRADDYIARCNPGRDWFFDHVRLIVTDAVCSSCGEHFSPRDTHLLTKCRKTCGMTRGGPVKFGRDEIYAVWTDR
jgi:hypothetical protein